MRMRHQAIAPAILMTAVVGLLAGCAGGPSTSGPYDSSGVACSTGVKQSPIDLRDATPVALSTVHFEYYPVEVTVRDSGTAVHVDCGSGSSLRVGDALFPLLQFHFHTPGEHAIAGQKYPGELHLVHDSGDGRLVVVGVMLDASAGSELGRVREISDLLPLQDGETRELTFHPGGLVPAHQQFFHYHGSLTTPPCTENVIWYVMQSPLKVNPSDLDALRGQQGDNARALQPRGERELLRSK